MSHALQHPFTCTQIRSEAKSQGSLLPEHHPYVKLIKRIGTRIAQKASDETGISGRMDHMQVRHMLAALHFVMHAGCKRD